MPSYRVVLRETAVTDHTITVDAKDSAEADQVARDEAGMNGWGGFASAVVLEDRVDSLRVSAL